MPVQVDDAGTLQRYLAGVVNRADHHGENVRYVVLSLVGAIVLFKDADSEIKVRTQEGTIGNAIWVEISGTRYAFSYEHASKSVVMKRGGARGEIQAHFTNATSVPQILEVFERLR